MLSKSVVKVSTFDKRIRWVRPDKPHLYRKPCGCWSANLVGRKSPLWDAAKGVARRLNSSVVCSVLNKSCLLT